MDFPIIIIWTSPLPFLGASGAILFLSIFDENPLSKHSAVLHLGLYTLPMSHKKDGRLKRVKEKIQGVLLKWLSFNHDKLILFCEIFLIIDD